MGGKSTATDLIVYTSIVAGILLFTRPGSQGPTLVNNTTNGYANIVKAETGQG